MDVNGISESDDEEGGKGASAYKQRYERAIQELEFTRRRLQQQHQDDLEQLVGLKKQLEKKVCFCFIIMSHFIFILSIAIKKFVIFMASIFKENLFVRGGFFFFLPPESKKSF